MDHETSRRKLLALVAGLLALAGNGLITLDETQAKKNGKHKKNHKARTRGRAKARALAGVPTPRTARSAPSSI